MLSMDAWREASIGPALHAIAGIILVEASALILFSNVVRTILSMYCDQQKKQPTPHRFGVFYLPKIPDRRAAGSVSVVRKWTVGHPGTA